MATVTSALRTVAPFHAKSPMFGFLLSVRAATSSAAVLPVAAKCSLFWMIWKNFTQSGLDGWWPAARANDGIEAVMVDRADDLTVPLAANYPDFPDSCFGLQFAGGEGVLEVLVDGAHVSLVELRHQSLRQPDGFTGKTAFDAGAPVFGRVQDNSAGGG